MRPDQTTSRLWSGNELTLETRSSFRALPHVKQNSQYVHSPCYLNNAFHSYIIGYCLTTTEYFIVEVANALVSFFKCEIKFRLNFTLHQVFYTVILNVLRLKVNVIHYIHLQLIFKQQKKCFDLKFIMYNRTFLCTYWTNKSGLLYWNWCKVLPVKSA